MHEHSKKFLDRIAWISQQDWMFPDEKAGLSAIAAAEDHRVDYEGFKQQILKRREARNNG